VIGRDLPHPGSDRGSAAERRPLSRGLGGGGLLSLAGALANAELADVPRAGGDYVYLREAFHPLAASWWAGSRSS